MSYQSTFSRSYRPGRSSARRRSSGPARRNNVKQNIHPSQFIRPAVEAAFNEYTPTQLFHEFELHPLLKQNVIQKGFTTPSQIQDQAIPHILNGKDVVGIANTGTGKTAAFGLPMLHRLMSDRNSRAIIIAPTRELAQQIEQECRSLAKGSGLRGAVLIGGAPMPPQIRDLSSNPQVVIGTPGRIKDHVERGSLVLSRYNIVVLDEVDRMLDMGFIVDIRFILDLINDDRQSLFFSATMDRKIAELIQTFTNEPVTISVKTGDTSDLVDQDVVRVSAGENKIEKLHDVLISGGIEKVLIFDATKHSVDRLSKTLVDRGFSADSLHGGKSQGQRNRALNRFKKNEVNILVATDVAARGIDISDITHVINFSTPNSYEDYVHRIGRAGRAGRKGYALTFVSE